VQASSAKGTLPVSQAAITANDETPVATTDQSAGAQIAGHSIATVAPAGGTISQEAVVIAANSLVKSGQQPGVASGNALAGTKDRKPAVAGTRAPDAAGSSGPAETGLSAPAESPGSVAVPAKSAVDVHRTAVSDGTQSTSSPVAGIEGLTASVQPHAAAASGSIDQPSAQASVSLGEGKASGVIASGTSEGLHSSLPATDNALSPLAHTTLSAGRDAGLAEDPRGDWRGWRGSGFDVFGDSCRAGCAASRVAGDQRLS
jgi:hypothetical protein